MNNKIGEKLIGSFIAAVIIGLGASRISESERRKEGINAVIREQNKKQSEKSDE